MKQLARYFWRDETGATSLEYGLIAGFISIAIVTALGVIGPQLSRIFNSVGTAVKSAK